MLRLDLATPSTCAAAAGWGRHSCSADPLQQSCPSPMQPTRPPLRASSPIPPPPPMSCAPQLTVGEHEGADVDGEAFPVGQPAAVHAQQLHQAAVQLLRTPHTGASPARWLLALPCPGSLSPVTGRYPAAHCIRCCREAGEKGAPPVPPAHPPSQPAGEQSHTSGSKSASCRRCAERWNRAMFMSGLLHHRRAAATVTGCARAWGAS